MELLFPYCKAVMDKQLLLIYALTFIIHFVGTLASRAHRRNPHAEHRRIASPVQHPHAVVAHLELLPRPFPRQTYGNGHRPACGRQPSDDTRHNADPHLPARLLPRRRALPGAQVGTETAAARRLQGRLVLSQDLRQPAQACQRHGPARKIRRFRLHDSHERHRHGTADSWAHLFPPYSAAMYARVLAPSMRVTSNTLSSIINGGGAIMMAFFICAWCRA